MTQATSHPFKGLYEFVRTHLLIINNVVLASCTVVAALDFMAPRLSLLPKLIYSATAILALAMIAVALAPAAAVWLWSLIGRQFPVNAASLWHWPGWQFGVALLVGVSVIGFASVTRASQGGLIASTFPMAKDLQGILFSIQSDVADIKTDVSQANTKLDKLSAAVDPAFAVDRCPDLACAVSNGADPEVVKRLFAKGAQLPGNPVLDGALLLDAALNLGATRFEVLDLLAQKGIDRNILLLPIVQDPVKLSKQGRIVALEIQDVANLDTNPAMAFSMKNKKSYGDKGLDAWNLVAGCLSRVSGGVALVEVAALLGDTDLVAYLHKLGVKPPSRPLACGWHVGAKSGYARIVFDPETGKYTGVSTH